MRAFRGRRPLMQFLILWITYTLGRVVAHYARARTIDDIPWLRVLVAGVLFSLLLTLFFQWVERQRRKREGR